MRLPCGFSGGTLRPKPESFEPIHGDDLFSCSFSKGHNDFHGFHGG
ncbi:hypothetical protein H7J50_06960 [Mycobacterium intermedium]|nr:hypothetical protein [Mycobacterium intermedium]MCV6963546.1 hypothetical protein [Mycobacterium intermedium]